MSTPTPAPFTIETRWDRPFIPTPGGESLLLVRITATAATTTTRRAPVDVALVIDRSGSMGGDKITAAHNAVESALDRLQDQDRVALVAFDDRIEVFHELTSATHSSRAEIRRRLRDIDARGSTNLGGGWLAGCQELAGAMRTNDGRIHRAILLTDGQANVGMVDPGELSHHAGQLRQRGISTTTLGFGLGFDEQLLTAMAEAGGGNFAFVEHPRQLTPFFARELGDLLQTVATSLRISFTMTDGLRGHLLSTYPHERQQRTIHVEIGDLPAGESIDLVFLVTTIAGTDGAQYPSMVDATWTTPGDATPGAIRHDVVPLTRTVEVVYNGIASDPDVVEKATLLRAAFARREAMQLDRAGRHTEARQRIGAFRMMMKEAPQTADIAAEMDSMAGLLQAPADRAWSEATHKSSAASSARRSRGRRVDPTAPDTRPAPDDTDRW